jgi:hypothetical protein
VQIVVGDDVVRLPVTLQPVEQAEIEEQVPQPAGRPDVDDRPPAGDVAHAGAVGVRVVRRAAQLGVVHQQQVRGVHDGQRADEQLGRSRPHARPVVRVGKIGGGGGQERRRRARAAARRAHVEDHPELGAAVGLEAERVHAAARVGRDGQGEAGPPAGVVEVVVVEVDGPVLLRRPAPVHLAAVPVVACDGALGRVHGAAVPVIGRAIGHAVGGNVGGEIPEADRVLGGDPCAPRSGGRHELRRRQRAARERRGVELAVEVPRRP